MDRVADVGRHGGRFDWCAAGGSAIESRSLAAGTDGRRLRSFGRTTRCASASVPSAGRSTSRGSTVLAAAGVTIAIRERRRFFVTTGHAYIRRRLLIEWIVQRHIKPDAAMLIEAP